MGKTLIFTDGSVHVQSKVGYGAVLTISEDELANDNLREHVQTKRFENTSSTKLELQTLLWALNEITDVENTICIYTDSQNIVELVKRRQRLEQNEFCSKKGVLLHNHELYKEFYQLIDTLHCEILKVQGHKPSRNRSKIEQVFTLVDKFSRKALRYALQ